MGLVDAPDTNEAVDGIPRVVVLGASIGGPDALRTFLAGIPPEFPALFLLVQHLENGYFERLAQQLQKATRLRVRALVPDGPFAATGEVLVVPANLRYTVERNGHIEAIAHDAPPHYTPCIDDVLRDAADRFGARTTAIIFSGMAGDAIEGAVYVTAKGGEVWVQDPASCVVSSMVDGARARGVVEYIGSPRELAERCVAQYGN
nr:chemotaxis protein CheB [Chiayiivirga flava]